ncbi:ATP-binding cassette domain-containing protein [uncultured Sulfitobacter sp.]|uniref:ATP-binding cassette domain-containing protein n=1 Tax=uncultured Sulfitobacter sp. TaxID=191468 RepID=UPI00260A6C71|nr:ATP-binding cassette domain-containing protein [uncultured Sulfitobacter sp.]
MTLLRARNLTRRYRLPRTRLLGKTPHVTAVDDVSFEIAAGRTLGVVGESGSGKSTLARMAMAFEAPDAGQVAFEGQDIHALKPAALRRLRPAFQMIFQDPFSSLDPRRVVGWSIAEPLRAMGIRAPERVREAFEQVGLHPRDGGKYPHEFSGGQRQRIAIARAIVTRPRLLIADEAVSALDVSVQAQILNLLMDLQDDLGIGILFISHDLAVVASICDTLLVLQHGKVLEYGAASDILNAPAHSYTRSLLKAAGDRM